MRMTVLAPTAWRVRKKGFAAGYALVTQAQALGDISPAVLEGFAAAKVLVEALRKAGAKPTRSSIQAALEGMRKFDIGGLEISDSATDHTGLDFADLSIISANGKFKR